MEETMNPAAARQALIAVVIAASLSLAPAVSHAQPVVKPTAQKPERYKVVLQVSDADPAKWNLALNNARNVQEDL
jgi:uncharacterized protein